MKKLILILCLCLSVLASFSQSLVTFGQRDSIYSAILKENRPLWIYSPPVDTTWFVKPAYPVVYVLDGDFHFTSIYAMMQELGITNGNTALPQMIIVGIPNTNGNRTRDLTPTADTTQGNSGGGEAFTAFMEKELQPYINHKYPVAPYNILMGHSLGGLLVTNTLLKHTSLFNAYVAIEPSMFWNRHQLLMAADTFLQQDKFKGKRFFLALSHTMKPDLDTQQVRNDPDFGSIHTSDILQLLEKLKKYSNNHLAWNFKYYEDDDHNSIPFVALYDGLRAAFPGNRFPTYLYFGKSDDIDSLKTLIVRHYQSLSAQRGYRVRPSEQTFNEFGYRHLQEKNFEKAKMFFQLNIDYFPESFNTYDGMGDYYNEIHNVPQAIVYWKKALALRNSPEIKEKIAKADPHHP
ncbi:alpha/beta fold hydrolase [Chitinophaga sp. 22321]|uniref:Alpha/beta hydrolase n=1 Tax=Chitinophaga hostae TaxID=2831022 RepID=A0ABS5J9G4_9BACT|nr:alpha/beta fold hydrolase [Chitinophaga hostae]MBS0031868.1 alpha/beta hydrolase [Chitinophaga hostae]